MPTPEDQSPPQEAPEPSPEPRTPPPGYHYPGSLLKALLEAYDQGRTSAGETLCILVDHQPFVPSDDQSHFEFMAMLAEATKAAQQECKEGEAGVSEAGA